MRVIIGLSLLALANAQSLQLSGANTGNSAASPTPGSQAEAVISVQQSNSGGAFVNAATNITPPNSGINGNVIVPTNNYSIQLPNSVTYAYVTVKTNQYTGQLQHRWSGSVYSAGLPSGVSQFTYTCDICAGSTLSSCNTPSGPGTVTNGGANVGTSPASGYLCANLSRNYLFGPLVSSTPTVSTPNTLAFALYDLTPIVSSYSLVFYRAAPAIIVGDPQIVGMQGQDFQVHGMPDEVFNLVTYPNLQINSRFVYLSSGECHDNFTACFAHPGTYISDEGIRLGSDKIHVRSGSFKKGLTVSVNGKKVKDRSTTSLKLGSVEIVNHRRVVITSPVMTVSISNSDHFLNQELELHDEKLVALGSKRRVLKDGEAFHSEVPLHGLQGQTWRNVEYPSGLDYEGTILDYMVNDGDIFGTDFVFNKFQL